MELMCHATPAIATSVEYVMRYVVNRCCAVGFLAYDRGMDKKQAIALAGSASKLAAILEISPQAVSKWPDGHIPALQRYRLKEKKPRWFRAPKPVDIEAKPAQVAA